MNHVKSVLKRVTWLQRLADVWKHRPGGARRSLLHRMPKASICADVGVDRGAFSELILRVVRPQTLHLIDPWKSLSSEAYRRARVQLEPYARQLQTRGTERAFTTAERTLLRGLAAALAERL